MTGSPAYARQPAGATLHELLAWVALAGIVATTVAPDFVRWMHAKRLEAAADRMAFLILGLRAAAASEGRALAVDLEVVDGRLRWQQWVDGDGDGVRRDDRERGTDRPRGAPVELADDQPGAFTGLPVGRRAPGGGRAPADGIAFGRDDLLVASPDGSTSSGSLYLRNVAGDAVAVRLYGPTGRVSVWRFRRDDDGWRRLW